MASCTSAPNAGSTGEHERGLIPVPADLTLRYCEGTMQRLNLNLLATETATLIDTQMQIRSKECSGCDRNFSAMRLINWCTEEQLINQPDRAPDAVFQRPIQISMTRVAATRL